jgi:hypothetical protein
MACLNGDEIQAITCKPARKTKTPNSERKRASSEYLNSGVTISHHDPVADTQLRLSMIINKASLFFVADKDIESR